MLGKSCNAALEHCRGQIVVAQLEQVKAGLDERIGVPIRVRVERFEAKLGAGIAVAGGPQAVGLAVPACRRIDIAAHAI